jgi:hypothetical protein
MIQYVGGIHARLQMSPLRGWSVFDTDMFHVLNSGEMNVFRLRVAVTPVPARCISRVD